MSDEVDAEFVEIVFRAADVNAAGERLVPLYVDPAESPALPDDWPPARIAWRVFAAGVLVSIIVGGVLLLLFAVWLGRHGQLPAPN